MEDNSIKFTNAGWLFTMVIGITGEDAIPGTRGAVAHKPVVANLKVGWDLLEHFGEDQ